MASTRAFEGVALLGSTFALAIVLTASVPNSVFAQTSSDLKTRCDQLTSHYDRYGVGRSENSDGARNHSRIAAGIDCQQGQYEKGISAMEALLKDKNIDVPPASTGVAARLYCPPGFGGRAPARCTASQVPSR